MPYFSPNTTTVQKIMRALEVEIENSMDDACRSEHHFRRAPVIEALARSLDAAVRAEQWMKERNI